MNRKSIDRKVRVAYGLLKDEGVLAVGIRTLEFAQKHQRKRKKIAVHNIDTGALYDDILQADITKPANKNWKSPKKHNKPLAINWLMPPPGKGSGGHMTLFRFIKYFEEAGHTCRIYFFNPSAGSTVEAVRAAMGDSFPKVKAEMAWLGQKEEMKDADIIFATSWQTAYTVYKSKVKAKKYYFVQDFEPYFYPIGSHYILAETTYKLGLRGITAGGWLEKRLKTEYGMNATHFDFGSDSKTYHYKPDGNSRKQIVFYARPTTPRRAFEVGILALDLFHKKHPDYTINLIGWDVSDIVIPFPYNNLGILTPPELNNLYNKCSASLVMSLTNMSLLPLELLSSGCIPVVSKGENNTLVSDNPHIVYSEADPVSLANTLSKTVSRKDLDKLSKKASESVASCSWDESGKAVVTEVVESYFKDGND